MKFAKVAVFLPFFFPISADSVRPRWNNKRDRKSEISSKSSLFSASKLDGECIPGAIVVANRNSGSITIISTNDGQQLDLQMPSSGSGGIPQPMYVQYAREKVYVGCRTNSEVVVFDARTYKVINRVPAGEGVFHMWTDGNRLWVVNDVDNSITVIDTEQDKAIKNIDLSAYLAGSEDKPHDIVATPAGDAVYVSLVEGTILKIDPSTFEVVSERTQNIGSDPHLAVTFAIDMILVPQQDSGMLSFLSQSDLSVAGEIMIPNAHGIGVSPNGRFAYVTDIGASAGEGAIYTVDTKELKLVGGAPVATGASVPHNVVVTSDNRLFITHSGPNGMEVTEHQTGPDGIPTTVTNTYTVGTNPFGIGYVEGNCQYS